jgi:hypothetical protein
VSGADAAGVAFAVTVSTIDGPSRVYEFNRERIVVGRADDADLRVEHSAIARRQFVIERIAGNDGAARFRIVPLGGRNATYVNGQPAIEGSVQPGEPIAVGPVRFALTQPRRKAAPGPRGAGGTRRPVVLAGALGIGLLLLWSVDGPARSATAAAAGNLEAPLFHALPVLSCPTVEACAARARERYAKGRQYEELAQSDPGNLYRAAIELAYAAQLRNASGEPLMELADVSARVDRAARRAQQLLDDARFRLQRAAAAGDGARVADAMVAIEQLIPEPTHPIRIGLDQLKSEMAKSGGDKK